MTRTSETKIVVVKHRHFDAPHALPGRPYRGTHTTRDSWCALWRGGYFRHEDSCIPNAYNRIDP